MFLERLNAISDRIDGTIALSLVDGDGIPVESVSSDPDVDLETMAAELVAVVRAISDDQRELAVGEVKEFAVTTDQVTLLLTWMVEGYYLLLVMGHQGSYGRARFELRRARLSLQDDLY